MLVTIEIPDDIAAWVTGIFEDAFPSLASGIAPEDKIREVIVSWIRSTLIEYETEIARREGDQAVSAAQAGQKQAVIAASKRASQAAGRLLATVASGGASPPAINRPAPSLKEGV